MNVVCISILSFTFTSVTSLHLLQCIALDSYIFFSVSRSKFPVRIFSKIFLLCKETGYIYLLFNPACVILTSPWNALHDRFNHGRPSLCTSYSERLVSHFFLYPSFLLNLLKLFTRNILFFLLLLRLLTFGNAIRGSSCQKKTQIVNKKQENSQKKNLLTLSLIVLKPSDELKT